MDPVRVGTFAAPGSATTLAGISPPVRVSAVVRSPTRVSGA